MTSPSPILWQSEDQTISLVDIPQSIAFAQGTPEKARRDFLESSEPIEAPFPSNEPKSASVRAKLENNQTDFELVSRCELLLTQARTRVSKHHTGSWCCPRPFTRDTPHTLKKRKLSGGSDRAPETPTNAASSIGQSPDQYLSDFARLRVTEKTGRMQFDGRPPADDDPSEDESTQISDHGLVSNSRPSAFTLNLAAKEQDVAYHFHVPPHCSFFLGDCSDSRSFHHAIRAQAAEHESRKEFDLILLDPPWPSRSVRRTHKTAGSTYQTIATVPDIQTLLSSMDLDMLMADACLVAIWITNKPTVREMVIGENGLFSYWGVELVEEWVWLKTTMHGEPVTALNSLWKKPYEVLLLGRRRKLEPQLVSNPVAEHGGVKRRVILGVPDLHSRKPCLKELLEPMLADPKDYRALEVFARHLVAGWWSWGDECIKFNWEGCWKSPAAGVDRDKERLDH